MLVAHFLSFPIQAWKPKMFQDIAKYPPRDKIALSWEPLEPKIIMLIICFNHKVVIWLSKLTCFQNSVNILTPFGAFWIPVPHVWVHSVTCHGCKLNKYLWIYNYIPFELECNFCSSIHYKLLVLCLSAYINTLRVYFTSCLVPFRKTLCKSCLSGSTQ